MEMRKLQKTGGSTYIVSLPKDWVVRNKLDASSILSIKEQRDGSLLIAPGNFDEKQHKEIEIRADENLRRKLAEKYLLGYDVLNVKFDPKPMEKQKEVLKEMLQHLMGFELVEETASSMIIQNLLDPTEISIMKSLRRMYTIVSVMHRDLIEAIEKGSKSLLKDVIQRDSEVNRLYFLVVRQIRTVIQNPALQDKEGIKAVDCVDYRLVANIVEKIGDCLEAIAETILKTKDSKIGVQFKKMLETTLEIHNLAAKALFKKDEQLAIQARDMRKAISFEKSKLKQDPLQLLVLNNIIKIADFGEDLADIVVSE